MLEHEEVNASLAQAEAMAFVACTKDFTQQSDEHQENYLWSLHNLLESVTKRHQNVLDQWYEQFNTLKEFNISIKGTLSQLLKVSNSPPLKLS